MPRMTSQEFSNAKAYVKGQGVKRAGAWATIGTILGGPVGGVIGGLAGYVTGGLEAAEDVDSGRVKPEPADGLKAAAPTILKAGMDIHFRHK